jgi:DNA invertase Pin-like site-specific DNA recombinase
MLVSVLQAFAAFEADLISARTKAALAVVRRTGSRSGRPIGNPKFQSATPAVQARICRLREEGQTYQSIADELSKEGIPTAQGGQWRAATIRLIYLRSGQSIR